MKGTGMSDLTQKVEHYRNFYLWRVGSTCDDIEVAQLLTQTLTMRRKKQDGYFLQITESWILFKSRMYGTIVFKAENVVMMPLKKKTTWTHVKLWNCARKPATLTMSPLPVNKIFVEITC